MTLHNKNPYGANHFCFICSKEDGYIRKYDNTNIYHFFILIKTMRKFLIKLDILLC